MSRNAAKIEKKQHSVCARMMVLVSSPENGVLAMLSSSNARL
jgi:hypothetical protein